MSSRPAGTRMRTRSAPAATSVAASSGAASIVGAESESPNHGRGASPRTSSNSSRAVRFASKRSSARAAIRLASASAAARRSGSASSSASNARSIAPFATSRASCCGEMSYSRSAIANGRAIPAARRSREPPTCRSTTAEASGTPSWSRPPTPKSRRSARSRAGVVDARARAPQAPARSSARRRIASRRWAGLPAGLRIRVLLIPPEYASARPVRSRRGRRRNAPPSRSAPGPSSRPWRSGQHRRPRRDGVRRRR